MRNSGLVLALVLVMVFGLALAGCGQTDPAVNNSGEDNRNDESAPGNEVVDVDFSDPEKVALAFWADYSAGKFDRAAQYLTHAEAEALHYFREVYEANPYILQFWMLMVSGSDAKVTGSGASGDWVILNVELTQPDFESLMTTEEGEELAFDVFTLLELSGFEMGGISEGSKMKFDEKSWNTAFSALQSAVNKLPLKTTRTQIELIEQEGKWKVDKLPFANLF